MIYIYVVKSLANLIAIICIITLQARMYSRILRDDEITNLASIGPVLVGGGLEASRQTFS